MNDAPRRLIDDPEVSGSLRDDLARAGEEHHASAAAYDTASKAAGFHVALASQGGGSAGMGLLVKLGIGTAAAAALMFAGAALHARLYVRDQAADRTAVTAPTPVAPVVTPPVVQAPQAMTPEAEKPIAPVAVPAQPTSLPARRAPRDDTPREIRQLARIRAHLQAGDAARALELADRGQRELGESTLWQEREALAVLALFDLGRTEQAQARSVVLLARFPNSPFRAELEHRSRRADEP